MLERHLTTALFTKIRAPKPTFHKIVMHFRCTVVDQFVKKLKTFWGRTTLITGVYHKFVIDTFCNLYQSNA